MNKLVILGVCFYILQVSCLSLPGGITAIQDLNNPLIKDVSKKAVNIWNEKNNGLTNLYRIIGILRLKHIKTKKNI